MLCLALKIMLIVWFRTNGRMVTETQVRSVIQLSLAGFAAGAHVGGVELKTQKASYCAIDVSKMCHC